MGNIAILIGTLIFLRLGTLQAEVPGVLGEKDFKEYAPINNLFFEKEQYQGKLVFKDASLDEKYIDRLFESEIWDLSLFINWELYNASKCTNEVLSENYDLYRFLYRALTISYLFEDIKTMRWEARKLNFHSTCDIDFKKEFTNCSSKTKDMKVFLQNTNLFIDQDEEVLSASHNYNEYYKNWLEDYKSPKKYSLSKSRVQSFCAHNRCSSMSKTNLEIAFKKSCEEDRALLSEICSEKDRIYGLSEVTEANYILSRSELIQSMENSGIIQGCLRRFSEIMKNQEVGARKLESIYSNVFQKLQKERKNSYAGELFKAANLKIFADKGLTEVFKMEEPKKEVVVTKPVVVPMTQKPVEKPKEVVKVEVKKTQVKAVPEPVVKEEPRPQYSAFLTAINFMQEYKLPLVKVDMLKLKYDYIFSPEVLGILETSIDKYMAIKALSQMKNYDKLGSKNGPVPLMFIKYMIDQEKHTGLYNLINTLGSKFYVENDLDGKEFQKPQFIEIKNDETTKNIWQIFVLDDTL